jgi:peptidyl-prolyl cis-trans isomerase C
MVKSARTLHWKALAALVALATAACGDREVVVRAGKIDVLRAEVEQAGGLRGRAADPRAALQPLADRALLAEAGRRAGIERDPAVRARLAAAKREILAQAYLAKELPGPPEDELRRRYAAEKEKLARRRVHVAQLAFHARSDEERARARSRASSARARLAGGEPFEKLAKELSDDRASAARGGDLGPILEGQVDKEFFSQVATLKKGEVSKPFESRFGCHVVRVLEDPQTVTPSYEEVKGLLAAEVRREEEERLLTRLRDRIGVETYPERLAKRAEPRPQGDRR